MKLIETYVHDQQGYNPLLIGPKWQMAILNYAPTEDVLNLDSLDVHFLTDEAFVLLSGHAVLIAATVQGDTITYDMVDMQPNIIYNIPVNMWHKIAMEPEACVLIVEDAKTHEGDFEYHYLSPDQIEQLRCEVASAKSSRKE